jgi:hypothetical protein
MENLERHYSEEDQTRKREIQNLRDELADSLATTARFNNEKQEAEQREKEMKRNLEDFTRRFTSKKEEFDSLQTDYTKL